MKAKLKNNNGMALVTVLVLIFVLSLMGTAMYAYSLQSLDVLKWGTDKKKADYIARAGVEAAAYAYQDTELAASTNNEAEVAKKRGEYATEFLSLSQNQYRVGIDAATKKLVAKIYKGEKIENQTQINALPTFTPENSPVIKTNKIYVCQYDSALDNAVLKDSKIVYVRESDIKEGTGETATFKRPYIGYFEVQILDDPQLVHTFVPAKGQTACNAATCTTPEHWRVQNYKKFISKGYVGRFASTSTASIVTTKYVNDWINKTTGDIEMDPMNDPDVSLLGLMTFTYPKFLGKDQVTQVPVVSGSTIGNLVVNNTSKREAHFPQANTSHGAVMMAMNNLFINSDINVTPTKNTNTIGDLTKDIWHTIIGSGSIGDAITGSQEVIKNASGPNVNALYLIGNNIVIHGDIELFAFHFSPKWTDKLVNQITGTIRLNKRMGTVILNIPSTKMATVADPAYSRSASTRTNEKRAYGKVFFDGNVYVTIGKRNADPNRYKMFSAGDVYYFNATKTLPSQNQGQDPNEIPSSTMGIDLLKYFLDTSIVDMRYPSSARRQLKEVRDFYYSVTWGTETYVTDDMRKVDPYASGSKDRITDLVPPSSSDASYIIWE